MIRTKILVSLVTSAIISLFLVNTLSVLMAIVEMRELTFINERLALTSRLAWEDVLESLTTFASVSLLLVNTFSTWMAVVELREKTFIDNSASSGSGITAIVDWTSAFGLSIDESADFIQFNLTRFAVINSALIWRWSWSRNTESTRMSDSVGRLIKELWTTLTGESLRKVMAFSILMAIVFSNSAFINESRTADTTGTTWIWTFIDKVVTAFTLVGFRSVLTISIRRTIMTFLSTLINSSQTTSSRTTDSVRRHIDVVVGTSTDIRVLCVCASGFGRTIILPSQAFIDQSFALSSGAISAVEGHV